MRTRHGSMLPLVVVVLAMVSLLAAGLTTTAWRANSASVLSRGAQDISRAIDVAAASAVGAWAADSVAQRAIGVTVHRTNQVVDAALVRTAWRRTHPLFAWLELDAAPQASSATRTPRRHERRAYWLRPPAISVVGALTASGMVEGEDGTTVVGADLAAPTTWCRGARATLTVPSIVAGDVAATPGRIWTLTPDWRAIVATEQMAIGSAWSAVASLLPAQMVGSIAQSPISDPEWRALRLEGDTVVLRGPMRWNGVLAVNGILRVEGAAEIHGLLMTTRALDASSAALVVHGAVIAGHSSSDRVRLSPSTRIQFDRCAVDLALATIATPRASPLGIRMPIGVW
ncbi:MAG: hypothetical protein IBJ03_15280 [Gemmatimonadaceae bacterium]|nr:hypothetical protein [Gemmatimonadaceae bacterium]